MAILVPRVRHLAALVPSCFIVLAIWFNTFLLLVSSLSRFFVTISGHENF